MKNKLYEIWKNEEKNATITGWDFSHIEGKYKQQELPWDYKEIINRYRCDNMKLLDIDTGGGEFLLSLCHPAHNLSATENYPPNVTLCKQKLLPLGIDFKQADANISLPFENDSFDMVINRHGSFNPKEIYRVLKHKGIFITQQVGAQNDRELVELLLGNAPISFPKQQLDIISREFENAGFKVFLAQETKKPIVFYDTTALVWFAKIIEWEFIGFSVDACLENLYKIQKTIETDGQVKGHIHRFIIGAQKL